MIDFGLANLDFFFFIILDRRVPSTAGGTIPQPGGSELFEKLAEHESECKPARSQQAGFPRVSASGF